MSTTAEVGIQPSSRVVRSDAIIFTEFDDAVVMMDVDEGRYYGLDPVGAKIWTLIESGPSVAEVCETLVATYEVAPGTCRDEVRAFMDELHRLGVIRILQGDDAKETHSGPGALSMSGRAEAVAPLKQKKELGGRVVWTTPAIQIMALADTASGTTSGILEGGMYTAYS